MGLANIKRRLHVGTKLRLVWHAHYNEVNLERTVCKVQTNAIAMTGEGFRTGQVLTKDKPTWLYWGPASMIEETDNGFIVYEPVFTSSGHIVPTGDREPSLRYEWV